MGTVNIDDPTDDDQRDPERELLRDIEVDKYLIDCVNIDPIALDEEFVRLPADTAYWNERYAQAIRDHLMAKLEHERTRARVLLEVREAASSAGAKLTVADLDARVAVSDAVHVAHLAVIEAEAERHLMRVRCDSLQAKRDMLQSLGAKVRAEMQDPAVREQHLGARFR